MRIIMVLLAILLSAPLPAGAQGTPSVITGDFADLKHTGSAKIDKIIDGQTILMKDGSLVRLTGIEYPFTPGPEKDDSMLHARETLEKVLPEGTDVLLYQTRSDRKGRTNRMGQKLAHLQAKKTGEWINGALAAYGYAYTMTDADNPEMAAQLYRCEDMARAAGKGLWRQGSHFGLLTPETASAGQGQFRVIEGTVNRAASSNNNVYLNFGSDWHKDFTAMMSPSVRKALSHRGIDALSLAGRKIRVRGWIRSWNGPFMELDTPERLEILSPASPPDAGQAKP